MLLIHFRLSAPEPMPLLWEIQKRTIFFPEIPRLPFSFFLKEIFGFFPRLYSAFPVIVRKEQKVRSFLGTEEHYDNRTDHTIFYKVRMDRHFRDCTAGISEPARLSRRRDHAPCGDLCGQGKYSLYTGSSHHRCSRAYGKPDPVLSGL